MAGASDKARFYLEQSIPELQELERKKIFSKAEVTSIAKKRSDFEHKLNARGSHPSDYARYAEYEMNLEALRRKRAWRTGIKASRHAGQKRIMFIMDRSTRKFHGDIGLWMQYLDYARRQKAYKKVSQILTSVLRLHPTRPELWIYAAKYVMDDQGDMTGARSYMQRGLRFCKQSRDLWLQYAKLEMIYIAKIAGRRKILGLDQRQHEKISRQSREDDGAEHIALPAITAEDINPSLRNDEGVDQDALQHLSLVPALSGAIPIAIFDAAMAQFQDARLGEQFFDMVAQFDGLPCLSKILQHVADRLINLDKNGSASWSCYARQPIVGIKATSSSFPKALGTTLSRLKSGAENSNPVEFTPNAIGWLVPYLNETDLDPDIRKVLVATISKIITQYRNAVTGQGVASGSEFASMLKNVGSRGMSFIVTKHLPWALEVWPANRGLLAIQDAQSLEKVDVND